MLEKGLRIVARRIILIALIVLLACTATGLSSCGSDSPALGAATQQKMRSVVEGVMRTTGAPGAVVGVWTPEGDWTLARGKADLRTGRAIELGDMVSVGSITDTFVSTVILQLAGEKRLGLDDPLGKYNTQVPNSSAITLRELLNHTSGIYDYQEDIDFLAAVVKNPKKEWTPREEVSIAAKHNLYFSPGKGWHYSNTNCTLLGMIVEKVTGNSLGNEINSRISDRLELKNTYLSAVTMVEGPSDERAHGYIEEEDSPRLKDVTDTNPSCYWAAGAMVSDVTDMRVYIEALATGELLKSETHEKRLTWVDSKETIAALRMSYGLGIAKIGGFLGQNGSVMGYSTAAYYLPARDATFFACITRYPTEDGTADKVVQDIAKILYPEEFPP